MAKGMIIAIRDVAGDFRAPTEMTHKEIMYRIDTQGPYLLLMPLADYTPARAEDQVRAKVTEWAQLVGKEIEVK